MFRQFSVIVYRKYVNTIASNFSKCLTRTSHTHQLNRVIPSMNNIIKLMMSNWKSLSTDMQCSAAGKLSLSTSAFPIELCSFFDHIVLFFYAAFITNYAPKMYQLCSQSVIKNGLLTYALSSNNSLKQSILAKGTPAFLNSLTKALYKLKQLTVRNYYYLI